MAAAVHTPNRNKEARHKLSLEQRACSVPYKKTFVVAVIATLLFYLAMIAFVTSLVTFFMAPLDLKRGAAYTLVALLPLCAFFWTVAYFKRRKATCPLCKCTPFLDNLAHKHQKSYRVKPLNYGTTAVLNVVFTQRWRCMYCGTPFDILKTKKSPGYVAYKDDNEAEDK